MKLSKHQFKSLIKKGWEEMAPISEPGPVNNSISAIWLNAGAVILFSFLFVFLLYLPAPSQSKFDTEEITISTIKENLIKITSSKGESL